jgi:hypothetical protein
VQETASLWKEREVIFSQFWEAAGSSLARSRQFEIFHLDWHRNPEPFGRQKVTDWITPAMRLMGTNACENLRPPLPSGRGELEQIHFLLGDMSVQTTERYLGCKQ